MQQQQILNRMYLKISPFKHILKQVALVSV